MYKIEKGILIMTFDRLDYIVEEIKKSLVSFHRTQFGEYEFEDMVDVLRSTFPIDIQFSSDSGASKGVLIFDDFVLKIPFMGYYDHGYEYDPETGEEYELEDCFYSFECGGGENSDNYCETEACIFEEINEYCDEEDCMISEFFAETKYLFEVNGLPFYIQQKCTEFCPAALSKEQRNSLRSFEEDEDIYEFPLAFLNELLENYGKSLVLKLHDTICKMGISDIHSGNVGYYNGKPIIFDYAGFDS